MLWYRGPGSHNEGRSSIFYEGVSGAWRKIQRRKIVESLNDSEFGQTIPVSVNGIIVHSWRTTAARVKRSFCLRIAQVRKGMISIPSPGKTVICGWCWNNRAAASMVSASTNNVAAKGIRGFRDTVFWSHGSFYPPCHRGRKWMQHFGLPTPPTVVAQRHQSRPARPLVRLRNAARSSGFIV